MKILFLSYRNSCRSQIAEAILRNCDKSLDIYSAGIYPEPQIKQVAIDVLKEIGIDVQAKPPMHFSEIKHIEFDFLITVGDGTPEEIDIPDIKYGRKLHLGFRNPYKKFRDPMAVLEKCKEIRDEIKNEIEYFYYKILKDQGLHVK